MSARRTSTATLIIKLSPGGNDTSLRSCLPAPPSISVAYKEPAILFVLVLREWRIRRIVRSLFTPAHPSLAEICADRPRHISCCYGWNSWLLARPAAGGDREVCPLFQRPPREPLATEPTPGSRRSADSATVRYFQTSFSFPRYTCGWSHYSILAVYTVWLASGKSVRCGVLVCDCRLRDPDPPALENPPKGTDSVSLLRYVYY